jgi:hypothetical protein
MRENRALVQLSPPLRRSHPRHAQFQRAHNLSLPRDRSAKACSLATHLTRSAPGQDTRSGQGSLARRHTDGPLREALLKTTVTCEVWRRSLDAPSSFLLQELRLFVGPKARFLVPDTDTGTGPIPPVMVFRVMAYSGGVLTRALP